MKYNILAKFLIPIDQSEVVLRDSLYSGIMHTGCYLLSNVSDNPDDWYCETLKRGRGYVNRAYRYVVAYEDWGNVFLKEDATEVDEDELDQRDYCRSYVGALLQFQAAINELLMEMNTTQVQNRIQADMDAAYEREREQERKQAAKREFERKLAEDPFQSHI